MFFIASKIAGFFALPSNIVAGFCTLGCLLLVTRFRAAGSRILLTGIGALLVLGYSPLANVMLLPLSERFPAWHSAGRTPDGIIVLGGAIDSEITVVRNSLEMDSSAERIVAMLELARQYPQARIVFTGGSGNLIQESASEAPIVGRLLESFGVAHDRVVLEGESRTTAENAIFTRRLVQPKPGELWLLVTSSFHMPRSIGAFRKAGFDVEAYPVDWRTRGWIDAATPFNKLSAGLARSDVAVHEWTGLIAYWLTGRSSEFFPKPR
jgi:uncharacterized SAM-binding protein YcdF (DUF218 family)